MHVISVNIAQPVALAVGRRSRQTGIYKQPVSTPVYVGPLGLAADHIGDHKHHGGPDQAVYLYSAHDYAWWSAELGQPLPPGTFGENLTLDALDGAAVNIGDELHIGGTPGAPAVILQATAPRLPCSTLATRMGDGNFVKRFVRAERPGVYARVLQTGHVRAGDAVTLVPYGAPTVGLLELFRDSYVAELSPAQLRRYLAAPIAIRDRVHKEGLLAKLG